jgi:hypothetical protein
VDVSAFDQWREGLLDDGDGRRLGEIVAASTAW